jgi:hypothetical protein
MTPKHISPQHKQNNLTITSKTERKKHTLKHQNNPLRSKAKKPSFRNIWNTYIYIRRRKRSTFYQ